MRTNARSRGSRADSWAGPQRRLGESWGARRCHPSGLGPTTANSGSGCARVHAITAVIHEITAGSIRRLPVLGLRVLRLLFAATIAAKTATATTGRSKDCPSRAASCPDLSGLAPVSSTGRPFPEHRGHSLRGAQATRPCFTAPDLPEECEGSPISVWRPT